MGLRRSISSSLEKVMLQKIRKYRRRHMLVHLAIQDDNGALTTKPLAEGSRKLNTPPVRIQQIMFFEEGFDDL
jgi:hypothetical protein